MIRAAAGLPPYSVNILHEWIDFNGHLRDAYYILAASLATDAALDQIGIGADYRERSACTMYTVELHMHYLREVKFEDRLSIAVCVFDFDRQRLHLGCRFACEGFEAAAANAEFMLVHVHQGVRPIVKYFPAEVSATLAALKHAAPAQGFAPGSRKIALPPA